MRHRERLHDHPYDPQHRHRGGDVACERGDAREPEDVVGDADDRDHDPDGGDGAPAVQAVPDRRECVGLVADPSERCDEDERGDEPGADDAEDRTAHECVRLPAPRAEVGGRHRVRQIAAGADGDDQQQPVHREPERVELRAKRHVGEPRIERHPERDVVRPRPAAYVERDDPIVAGGIVVLDLLLELGGASRRLLHHASEHLGHRLSS